MNNTNHCQDLLAVLSDYIDGDLPAGICSQLEEHLRGCENCRIVVDTLQKTIELCKDNQDESCPDEARIRLFHRLQLDDFLKS